MEDTTTCNVGDRVKFLNDPSRMIWVVRSIGILYGDDYESVTIENFYSGVVIRTPIFCIYKENGEHYD